MTPHSSCSLSNGTSWNENSSECFMTGASTPGKTFQIPAEPIDGGVHPCTWWLSICTRSFIVAPICGFSSPRTRQYRRVPSQVEGEKPVQALRTAHPDE